MKALVVGARPFSLGDHVADFLAQKGWTVFRAGVSGEEISLDITDGGAVESALQALMPDAIVCTVGVNVGHQFGDEKWLDDMTESLRVNTIAPLNLLHQWLQWAPLGGRFVAISSNSAHIARRNSSPYCASKAALSMGLRVAARETAGSVVVWGYEFGLLEGTPMTQQTEERFGPSQTRIPGQPQGLNAAAAAARVAADVASGWVGLNGVLQRLDGGEQ